MRPIIRWYGSSTSHGTCVLRQDPRAQHDGVATGSTAVSTNFDVPSGMPTGPCELYVVANGIPSAASACNVGSVTTTTLALGSNSNPSTYGTAVTFTATVTPVNSPAPTGTVNLQPVEHHFRVLRRDAARFRHSAMRHERFGGPGNNSIAATYSGDSNYSGSSGSLTQTVNRASQTIIPSR